MEVYIKEVTLNNKYLLTVLTDENAHLRCAYAFIQQDQGSLSQKLSSKPWQLIMESNQY